jgi:hypothetical protein
LSEVEVVETTPDHLEEFAHFAVIEGKTRNYYPC